MGARKNICYTAHEKQRNGNEKLRFLWLSCCYEITLQLNIRTNKLNIQPRPRKRTKERKAQNANQSRETLNMYSCNSLWIDKAYLDGWSHTQTNEIDLFLSLKACEFSRHFEETQARQLSNAWLQSWRRIVPASARTQARGCPIFPRSYKNIFHSFSSVLPIFSV